MLDFVQLMNVDTSSKQLDSNVADDLNDNDLNESSFILLMAQVLLNSDTEEVPDSTGEIDINPDTKFSSDEIEVKDFGYDNQAMAWINSDDFLPPTEADVQTDVDVSVLEQADITAKTVAPNALPIDDNSIGLDVDSDSDSDLLQKGIKVSTDTAQMDNTTNLKKGIAQMSQEHQEETTFSQNINDAKPNDATSKLDLSSLTPLANVKTNIQPQTIDTSSTSDGSILAAPNQQTNLSNAAASPAGQANINSLDIPVQVSDGEWGDQFNQHIVWLGKQHIKSAQIKLNPPELGPLDITIKMDKQSAQLNINSHSLQVRDALDQALPRLREMMAEQGLNLGEVNIESNAKDQQQQSNYQPEMHLENDGAGENVVETSTITRRSVKGLIDYFA